MVLVANPLTNHFTVMTPLPPKATVCIISARRYGDAIINAAMIKLAAQARPDINWIVWTKPQFVALFQEMGLTNIITSEFPIAGGVRNFTKDWGKSLIKAICQLRQMHIDASLDFIGDFRESYLGAFITGNHHLSPQWGKAHWMRKLIWKIPNPFIRKIAINKGQQQIYEIQKNLLSTLVGCQPAYQVTQTPIPLTPKIAFHPFSSQAFKLWPYQNWLTLTASLVEKGISPTVLCATNEFTEAHTHFGNAKIPTKIKSCPSIAELIEEIKKIDILIGVDSFLVHLASAFGKRVIIINTGNLPSWWAPPNSIAIGQSGGCTHYPCSNEPLCLGTPSQSQCIKSITPQEVSDALSRILSVQDTPLQ